MNQAFLPVGVASISSPVLVLPGQSRSIWASHKAKSESLWSYLKQRRMNEKPELNAQQQRLEANIENEMTELELAIEEYEGNAPGSDTRKNNVLVWEHYS